MAPSCSRETSSTGTPLPKRRCEGGDATQSAAAPLTTEPIADAEEYFPPLIIERVREVPELTEDVVSGCRIVDINHMAKQFARLNEHTMKCTYGRTKLVKEIRSGLHSTLVNECVACGVLLHVTTSPSESEINDAAVWGSLAVGIGHGQLEELMGVVDVPVMTAFKFRNHERKIGKNWEDHLTNKMKEHGREELRLARLAGDEIGGVPFITVVVDGGWGKRSYRHGYNALSGLACIIGARTNKLLYLGVKNKYCITCLRARGKTPPSRPHVCFKNYNGTSTAMEQEVIVEGFCASIQEHGLIYKYMVGDGDSSVFARVRQHDPYGRMVEKRECANHVVRCYKDKLYSLCKNKLYNLEFPKVLKPLIDRLCKGTRAAIRNCTGDAQRLKAAIVNAPYHVLGKHTQCGDFCSRKEANDHNIVPEVEKTNLWTEVKKQFLQKPSC